MATKKEKAILAKLNGFTPYLSEVGAEGSKECKDHEKDVAYLVQQMAGVIHKDLCTPEGKTGTNKGTWASIISLAETMLK